MGKNIRIGALLFVSLAAMLTASSASSAEEALIKVSPEVSYVSGGVGEESFSRLRGTNKDYNLTMLFAQKSGAYVSSAGVTIVDAKGQTVIDAISDGPLFYAKLPSGSYKVTVNFDGKSITRRIKLGAKQMSMDFRWL